jgi:hypothetical protein
MMARQLGKIENLLHLTGTYKVTFGFCRTVLLTMCSAVFRLVCCYSTTCSFLPKCAGPLLSQLKPSQSLVLFIQHQRGRVVNSLS